MSKDVIREAAEEIRGCVAPNTYYEGPRDFTRAVIEDNFVDEVAAIIRAAVEREQERCADILNRYGNGHIYLKEAFRRIRQGGE